MELPDADLMIRIGQGDAGSFAELVRRHERPLVNFFHRLLWDRHMAEDCAQEVFLRVYRSAPHYQPTAKFTTWLYRVARNLWIDRVRTAAAGPATVSYDAPMPGAEGDAGSDGLPAALETPPAAAIRGEEVARLRRAIDGLPETHRLVLILGELQGLPYGEVSDILDIPVGTVKSRMHAALLKLKAQMEREGKP